MNKNDLRAAQRLTRIDTLHAAIVEAGPQGMKRADIAKLGYAASAVPDYLQELRREGRIILVPYGTQSVYCATQELADAREAELVRETKQKDIDKCRRKRAAKRAANPEYKPRGATSRKPRPQEHQKITIRPPKPTAAQVFSGAPADYSRAVITRIPTPPGRWATAQEFSRYARAVQALRAAV